MGSEGRFRLVRKNVGGRDCTESQEWEEIRLGGLAAEEVRRAREENVWLLTCNALQSPEEIHDRGHRLCTVSG